MVGGERKPADLSRVEFLLKTDSGYPNLKSKRVQESRDRESVEGSKNSRRIVALLRVEFLLKTDILSVFPLLFFSFFMWCLVRVRVKDGRGEAEVS